MRPLNALIVPLWKLPESVIREDPSTSLRSDSGEFSLTTNNTPPAVDFISESARPNKLGRGILIRKFGLFHYDLSRE